MSVPRVARAAVMPTAGAKLELREYPLPRPLGREALVRINCCTICRSDLHSWLGRRSTPTPIILGHEIVGTIVDLGDELTHDSADQRLAVGDRVTWTLHSSCGHCFYCAEKQLPMKCRRLRKYGHDACDQPPHLQGGFAEYCLINSGTGIVKLPDELSDTVAAPANCATATIVAGWEAAGLAACQHVLIQGAGSLGCYAAAYAAHAGCHQIFVTDVDRNRLRFIRQFGATHCLDVTQNTADETVDRIRDLTGGLGVDCAMEVAGSPTIIDQGLKALRKGGQYIEIGCSFPEATAPIDMSLVLWNRLSIHGVHNYDGRHLRRAVDFLTLTRNRFPYETLVGARYSLQEINTALQVAESGRYLRVAVVCE